LPKLKRRTPRPRWRLLRRRQYPRRLHRATVRVTPHMRMRVSAWSFQPRSRWSRAQRSIARPRGD